MSEADPKEPPPSLTADLETRDRGALWGGLFIVLGLLVLFGGGVFVIATGLAPTASPAPSASSPPPLFASPPTPFDSPAPAPPPPPAPAPAPPSPTTPPSPATPPATPPSSTPSPPRASRASHPPSPLPFPPRPDDAALGPSDAPVALELFGDLSCPHTRAALRALVEPRLPDATRAVFRHFPLVGRPDSARAARVVAAAGSRVNAASLWNVLRAAANSRAEPTPAELGRWLGDASVTDPVSALVEPELSRDKLEADARLAAELDVSATPTLFVNGRKLVGAPPEGLLAQLIRDERRTLRWLEAQGLPRAEAQTRRVQKNLIDLGSDAVDRACLPSAGAPVDGPESAPLTLVEFTDFQCTHCRRLQSVVEALLKRHPGQIRRVWRGFPLPQNERARRIAGFALAARDAGGDAAFWQLHDALFAERPALPDAALLEVAARFGLPGPRLLERAELEPQTSALNADLALGKELGVDGTPMLFLNGRRISGFLPLATLEPIVAEELATARRIARRAPRSIERLLCDDTQPP